MDLDGELTVWQGALIGALMVFIGGVVGVASIVIFNMLTGQ